MRFVSILLFLAFAVSTSASAQDDPRMKAPTGLIITYSASSPADRPALRNAMVREGAAQLARLKQAGTIAHYRLLWNRYADNVTWDMMLVLDLGTPKGIGAWRSVEEQYPGGLPASAARMVKRIDSAPIDIMSSEAVAAPLDQPTYLVVPYDYLVSVGDYITYVRGYVVPQMKGWLAEGALDRYDFLLSRYPAGRPWTAMLLLAYRGDEGLGRRDATTARVRARLAADPSWKAFADNKGKIREEFAPVVADVLSAQ